MQRSIELELIASNLLALARTKLREGVKKPTVSRKDAKAQSAPCKNPLVCFATFAHFAPLREVFFAFHASRSCVASCCV
jgi:hypothetical protein